MVTHHTNRQYTEGFTLFELSIVIVIIGFIAGGILVGRDLIYASGVRATIAQIERYNQAVRTFEQKYNDQLPGDMNATTATQFGFAARGAYAGEGDGNGIIEGVSADAASSNGGQFEGGGETLAFWVDLSAVKLIDDSFTIATPNAPITSISGTFINNYFPAAKLGNRNYIYVWSGGWAMNDGINYYGISNITRVTHGLTTGFSKPGLTVKQAYDIDNKIDDGMPQTGAVIAMYLNGGRLWIGDYDGTTGGPVVSGDGIATAGSATTCYDNSNTAGATEIYSLAQNNGTGINCVLSFKFQ